MSNIISENLFPYNPTLKNPTHLGKDHTWSNVNSGKLNCKKDMSDQKRVFLVKTGL